MHKVTSHQDKHGSRAQANQQKDSQQNQPQSENQSDLDEPINDAPSEEYSYLGPHGQFGDEDTDPDGYGPQDQFGDVDNQDPYSNLYDQDPDSTPGGEGLQDPEQEMYGLAAPLAQEGDKSRQGSDKGRYGTRRSQDQQGYQQ